MLMPKTARQKIYEQLFEQGVMTAKKDVRPTCMHSDVGIRNLYVIKALQSLKSRGYVREQFAWRSYYWFLTNEGITYLREVLHLPAEIVPATLKRHVRAEPTRAARPGGEEGAPGGEQDERRAYRKGPVAPGEGKEVTGGAVGPGDVQFSRGYGRGSRPQQ